MHRRSVETLATAARARLKRNEPRTKAETYALQLLAHAPRSVDEHGPDYVAGMARTMQTAPLDMPDDSPLRSAFMYLEGAVVVVTPDARRRMLADTREFVRDSLASAQENA